MQIIPFRTTPATRSRLLLFLLWVIFYASFSLVAPPLLDDADSVHAEVAREMVLRHDWVTLYANGIRYLEKAPLLYWSMAASFKLFGPYTAAARLPIALTVLLLALVLEIFGRRAFADTRAGRYAGIITLSSFGIFIFTRITIPDAMVCLWLSAALLCYWRTDQQERPGVVLAIGFALCCALNVLTKGLIGIVFPVGIVVVHLAVTRGLRGAIARIAQLHPVTGIVTFLLAAAPWHILAGLANPDQGTPGALQFLHGHWSVPVPTQGNVHGWTWFYFVNEHLLRYLNLRVPRDYDTVPLLLFWGLLLVWIFPWSGYLFHAVARVPWLRNLRAQVISPLDSTRLLLGIWAAVPMLFFSFSTRQEYYVLPAIPALLLLIAGWLAEESAEAETFSVPNPRVRSGQRISVVLFALGGIASLAAAFLAIYSKPPNPSTDLAALLRQNPGDYALSFGHFLDLNAQAMGAFRTPLLLTAVALFTATFGNWWARRDYKPHTGNLFLATGAFLFLYASHMGLQIFSPVLTSYQLAQAIAPVLKPDDLIVLHGEYEAGSTLGFYLRRNDLHLYQGRSSNLWYGSFFPDAPARFEDEVSLDVLWTGPHRVFLWQDLTDPERPLPTLPGHTFFIAHSGGKEILSNQPNPY